MAQYSLIEIRQLLRFAIIGRSIYKFSHQFFSDHGRYPDDDYILSHVRMLNDDPEIDKQIDAIIASLNRLNEQNTFLHLVSTALLISGGLNILTSVFLQVSPSLAFVCGIVSLVVGLAIYFRRVLIPSIEKFMKKYSWILLFVLFLLNIATIFYLWFSDYTPSPSYPAVQHN